MWLIPSKGRPNLAKRLFEAADFKEPGILILNTNDELEYRSLRLPEGWRRVVTQPTYLSDALNRGLSHASGEPWYGILNDDHLPKTVGWERAVIEAAGLKSMAWPHDNYAKRISCHVKGGDLVRKLGWFVCPRMKHFWLDDADELIAKEVGGVFLENVMVSHEHVNAGRMKPDRTYVERPSNSADRQAFLRWKEHEWPELQERLKDEKTLRNH
jgi:hypothetical protein